MNYKAQVTGDVLTITIDVSAKAREAAKPSSTGKSMVLATTSGFTRFGDVGLSLNCTIPTK